MSNKKEVIFLREEYGEGSGKYTFPNGGKYVGGWKENKKHGQGKLTIGKGKFEGDKYEGDWKDGKQHRQGNYISTNGSKYVGEYKDGKENGQGILTFHDGIKLEGEFKEDEPWNTTGFDKDGNIFGKYVNGVEQ